MDPNHEIENLDEIADDPDADDSVSVDDFIKELELKEKDLHIPANTTILEISESFVDVDIPEFLKKDLAADKPESVSVTIAPATTTIPQTNSAKFELMIAELKDELTGVRAERDDLFRTSQRRAKDFENYKSRTERERNETFQNQVGNLATQMLPALDNLERVRIRIGDAERKGVEIQQFLDGIVLVSQQINDVLSEMGIQPIATVGEVFDPHYHEAVVTEESDEFEPNTVSAELLRGYRIGDRVIRHSMVKVAKAAHPAEESAEPIEAETEQDTEPENFDTPDYADE